MVPTQKHAQIQEWAQSQDAYPAQLRRRKYDGEPAILTFVFGENTDTGPDIYLISWEMFFAQFDLMGLSMAFEDCGPRFVIVKVDEASASYPEH